MKQDFSNVMSARTDEELIEIVQVKREDYQAEAVAAAEKELQSRNVSPDQIKQVEQEYIEKETKGKEINAGKVSSWIRLIHFIIDGVAFLLTAFVLSIFLDLFLPAMDQESMVLLGNGLFFASFFLYYVFMEYKYQKTLGKFLTNTKVVMRNGEKPKISEIFIRTVCRLVPLDGFSFLFTRTGLHDRFSNTIVIKHQKESADACNG